MQKKGHQLSKQPKYDVLHKLYSSISILCLLHFQGHPFALYLCFLLFPSLNKCTFYLINSTHWFPNSILLFSSKQMCGTCLSIFFEHLKKIPTFLWFDHRPKILLLIFTNQLKHVFAPNRKFCPRLSHKNGLVLLQSTKK